MFTREIYTKDGDFKMIERNDKTSPLDKNESLTENEHAIPPAKRIICIDILRGFAILIMLLADTKGDPARVYLQLQHAGGNGFHLADFGFPLFVLVMGMSVPISIKSRLNRKDSVLSVLLHAVGRCLILCFLGLFIAGFPDFSLDTIRIPGVLQRIAFVNLIAQLLEIAIFVFMPKFKFRRQALSAILIEVGISFAIIAASIIVFYCSTQIEATYLSVDRSVFGSHLLHTDWDPEGVLGSIWAIASGLLGAAIGNVLISSLKQWKKVVTFFISGIILFALAFMIHIPINKDLWSCSYVLLTAGMAAVLVGILYFVTDVCKIKSWSTPLCLLGSSPIFLYVVSELLLRSLWLIPVGAEAVTLNVWITSHCFTPWAGDLDSLYFSLMYAVLWIAVLAGFKRKGIRFKV
jgi:predicted acyltransferase